LQYQNLFQEFYVIILEEKKKDLEDVFVSKSILSNDLDGYFELITTDMKKKLKDTDFSKIHTCKINNLKAKKFILETKLEGIDIYYQFAFLESKSKYYQIVVWTLLSKKVQNAPKMEKLINSFKELRSRGESKS
jgi:hypothetical protein